MLHRYHSLNNILIFNLSDRKSVPRLRCPFESSLLSGRYDYEKFRNQIVEFGFPDHYSPPLDVLFQIVLAIDNWVKSSPKHVAVVHCMVQPLDNFRALPHAVFLPSHRVARDARARSSSAG